MNKINYRIEIPNSVVSQSFRVALEQRGNFFHNIRLFFKRELEAVFEEHGLCVNTHAELGFTNFLKNINFFFRKYSKSRISLFTYAISFSYEIYAISVSFFIEKIWPIHFFPRQRVTRNRE